MKDNMCINEGDCNWNVRRNHRRCITGEIKRGRTGDIDCYDAVT
jgi:hypothetical protein